MGDHRPGRQRPPPRLGGRLLQCRACHRPLGDGHQLGHALRHVRGELVRELGLVDGELHRRCTVREHDRQRVQRFAEAAAREARRQVERALPLSGMNAATYTSARTLSAPTAAAVTAAPLNGRTGLVVRHDGRVVAVVSLDVAGAEAVRVWVVVNPDKLRSWTTGRP
ncbi:hypothetical protein [Streptomyces albogriseolus]|uniref:hypothetical protein n=1 Tax=Streptomyces albogriseolus TaxID=1887 RepID=UPI0033B6EB36